MGIQDIRKALITNVGRVARRVITNIEQIEPEIVYIFKQENPGWNEKNPGYKKVLDSFKKHPTIQSLMESNKLRWVEIDCITDYTTLFEKLAELTERCSEKFDVTYIDCTAFTKLATIVAQHLSGMSSSNVVPILNPSTAIRVYVEPRDSEFLSDPGTGPEAIPFIKIDTSWVSNPESNPFKVVKAAYTIIQKPDNLNKKFNKEDLKRTINEIELEISPVALGRAVEKLINIGLLVKPLFLAGPDDLRMTMPAFALVRRLLE